MPLAITYTLALRVALGLMGEIIRSRLSDLRHQGGVDAFFGDCCEWMGFAWRDCAGKGRRCGSMLVEGRNQEA